MSKYIIIEPLNVRKSQILVKEIIICPWTSLGRDMVFQQLCT